MESRHNDISVNHTVPGSKSNSCDGAKFLWGRGIGKQIKGHPKKVVSGTRLLRNARFFAMDSALLDLNP